MKPVPRRTWVVRVLPEDPGPSAWMSRIWAMFFTFCQCGSTVSSLAQPHRGCRKPAHCCAQLAKLLPLPPYQRRRCHLLKGVSEEAATPPKVTGTSLPTDMAFQQKVQPVEPDVDVRGGPFGSKMATEGGWLSLNTRGSYIPQCGRCT